LESNDIEDIVQIYMFKFKDKKYRKKKCTNIIKEMDKNYE